MRFYRSDQLAYSVLSHLRKKLKDITDKAVAGVVTNYENCREQGFVVKVNGGPLPNDLLTFTFSENRNSDDVVVYLGDFHAALKRDIDAADVEKMYRERRFFKTPDDAADFMAKQIREILENARCSARLSDSPVPVVRKAD